jgi:uncharacterized membrane protein
VKNAELSAEMGLVMLGISLYTGLIIGAIGLFGLFLLGVVMMMRRQAASPATRASVRNCRDSSVAQNTQNIGAPVSSYRVPAFFGVVLTISVVLATINQLLTHTLWVSAALSVFLVASLIVLAKQIGVLISLGEGEAVNVDRFGGYHHTLFCFSGHVTLNRDMVDRLNDEEIHSSLKAHFMVGEIVEVAGILQELRKIETSSLYSEFAVYASDQEYWNNRFGGLRVVGWPWIDKVHVFSYPTVEVEKVEEGKVTRFKEKLETKTGVTRLVLSDVTKPLVLANVETAPMPSTSTQKDGYGFPIDLLFTSFVRVTHPYLAVYKTREGWAHILTNLLRPVVLEVVRKSQSEEVSENLAIISNGIRTKISGEEPGTVNHFNELRERYGLELRKLPIQDTQMSDPEDDRALKMATANLVTGKANLIKADYDAKVTVKGKKADAEGLEAIVLATIRDPITARHAMTADAAKTAQGTIILSMGGGDTRIDPGTQVLIQRLEQLTDAMKKGQDSKSKPSADKPSKIIHSDDDDEEEDKK